jgi:hypothetical protein
MAGDHRADCGEKPAFAPYGPRTGSGCFRSDQIGTGLSLVVLTRFPDANR